MKFVWYLLVIVIPASADWYSAPSNGQRLPTRRCINKPSNLMFPDVFSPENRLPSAPQDWKNVGMPSIGRPQGKPFRPTNQMKSPLDHYPIQCDAPVAFRSSFGTIRRQHPKTPEKFFGAN